MKVKVHYNGIADISFEWVDDGVEHTDYVFGGSLYGWSTNPVRDAVCEELKKRYRHFVTKEHYRPTAYEFLSGKDVLFLPALKEAYHTQQVWEGISLQELIENRDKLMPRIEKEYGIEFERLHMLTAQTDSLSYMLDKFTRMNAVQMASFALRKLSTFKRQGYGTSKH